jgi:hypothetical protein
MSIFTKSSNETPPAVRTPSTISKEREENRAAIVNLSARRDELTRARAALEKNSVANPIRNSSELWQMEKIDAELRPVTEKIERAERFEKALAFDLMQLLLPAARSEEEKAGSRVEKGNAESEQMILALVPGVMEKIEKVLDLIKTANAAHEKAERISGENIVYPKYSLSPQVIACLRPLWALGQSNAEWHSRMFEIGRGIPLGEHHLFM